MKRKRCKKSITFYFRLVAFVFKFVWCHWFFKNVLKKPTRWIFAYLLIAVYLFIPSHRSELYEFVKNFEAHETLEARRATCFPPFGPQLTIQTSKNITRVPTMELYLSCTWYRCCKWNYTCHVLDIDAVN